MKIIKIKSSNKNVYCEVRDSIIYRLLLVELGPIRCSRCCLSDRCRRSTNNAICGIVNKSKTIEYGRRVSYVHKCISKSSMYVSSFLLFKLGNN